MQVIWNLVHIIEKTLFGKWVIGVFLLSWLIFQFIFVYYGAYSDLISDSGFYVYYATECVKNGTMYPDYTNLNDEYIFNPGYINFLVVWIKLFGSVKFVPYFNIVLNIIIVWLIYIIGKQMAGKKVAYLSVFFFMLIPSYTTIVLHLYSEQLFVIFILLSILPFIKISTKRCHYAYSGIGVALAQWIRPLSLAWQLPCVMLLMYKKEYKKCIVYVVNYAITCFVIAVATHHNFPDYLYKANTGGVNIIMGANDLADGTYCGAVRRDKNGLGYLENVVDDSHVTNVKLWYNDTTFVKRRNARYTYRQYDSIYVSRATAWIKNNPVKWMKVSLKKIYWTFYDVPSFFYTYGGDLTVPSKFYSKVYGKSSIIYTVFIIFSFLSILINIKRQSVFFLVFIPTMCYLFSIFVTCGATRYSMPLIPFFCILSAIALYNAGLYIIHKLFALS